MGKKRNIRKMDIDLDRKNWENEMREKGIYDKRYQEMIRRKQIPEWLKGKLHIALILLGIYIIIIPIATGKEYIYPSIFGGLLIVAGIRRFKTKGYEEEK